MYYLWVSALRYFINPNSIDSISNCRNRMLIGKRKSTCNYKSILAQFAIKFLFNIFHLCKRCYNCILIYIIIFSELIIGIRKCTIWSTPNITMLLYFPKLYFHKSCLKKAVLFDKPLIKAFNLEYHISQVFNSIPWALKPCFAAARTYS